MFYVNFVNEAAEGWYIFSSKKKRSSSSEVLLVLAKGHTDFLQIGDV